MTCLKALSDGLGWSLVRVQIAFGNHVKPFVPQGFQADFRVVDHQGDGGPAAGMQQDRVGLDDVHLGLQERRADSQQWLMVLRQFHADQVAFDQREPGPLEDLSALFRVAEQEAGEGAFS